MTRLNTSAQRFGAHHSGDNGGIATVNEARDIVSLWLKDYQYKKYISFGLPEVNDRYGAWHVSLLNSLSGQAIGEILISCRDGAILQATDKLLISRRLGIVGPEQIHFNGTTVQEKVPNGTDILCGDARDILKEVLTESLQLVITSPPYFNAKPVYGEHSNYEEYLTLLKEVFQECHRVLVEGRFFVVNASPILVRRPTRSESSKRIPVPFHINSIVEKLGFDFIDDIIWVKPEGAGWNTGRGRRFAADRHPLQYKPVPVTEYFLVYRKHTDKLIDWNIRNHPDQEAVKASKISDGYDVTNVWRSSPSHHPSHPAVFPEAIIRKFIRYYSFKGDIVLDPFAGIGTVGKAAIAEERGFFLIDNNERYYKIMVKEISQRKSLWKLI